MALIYVAYLSHFSLKMRRRCEGGGVMILIRNDIIPHVEITDETITDTHLEIFWIKTKEYPPIYIGAYYGKQEYCKLAEINKEYERLSNSICGKNTCDKEIILMWDFNAKLEIEREGMKQNQNRNKKLLYQLLETTGMSTINTKGNILEPGQE